MRRASQPRRPSSTEHPAALGSWSSWMRILLRSGGIDRRFVPRALFVILTTLVTGPFRLWETLRHGRRIRQTKIHPAPIFIVGHWRSGTTHLQNLLCQDERLASLTTFQAMTPGFFLIGDGWMKPLLSRVAAARYPTRLIDNIPLTFDAPQEDEFALANLSPHAFIHTFTLPRQAHRIFEREVLFRGRSPAAQKRWADRYLALLRKVTLANGGRQLVVKNCAHSARLPMLLDLFPDAKFIHIHRNPYDVYLSTLHMHRTVFARSQLQEIDPSRVEENVLTFYEVLLRRFAEDRARIPEGCLVEVRFDDLEDSPMSVLRRVYQALDIPGFDVARKSMQSYLDSVSDYRKNRYELDDAAIKNVNKRWGFVFDTWGYDRIEPG